eukprot:g4175.t1
MGWYHRGWVGQLSPFFRFPLSSVSKANQNRFTKVIVGLSGGVDSSVAALLLKKEGYQVEGVHMVNWDEDDEFGTSTDQRSTCLSSKEQFELIQKLGTQLDIPVRQINLAKEYWHSVFVPFVDAYSHGFTPNPDIVCNRAIKFKAFMDHALLTGANNQNTNQYQYYNHQRQQTSPQQFQHRNNNTHQMRQNNRIQDGSHDPYEGPGPSKTPTPPSSPSVQMNSSKNKRKRRKRSRSRSFPSEDVPQFVATGHYARIRCLSVEEQRFMLLRGVDETKDQSYFLTGIHPSRLKNILFPLGDLHKTEVRDIARQHNLITAEAKESMGVCFIGRRARNGKFASDFLTQYLPENVGSATLIDSFDGSVIKENVDGALFWTLGQKAKLGGRKASTYVIAKNMTRKEVVIVEGSDHPDLYHKAVYVELPAMNWLTDHGLMPAALLEGKEIRMLCKVRHSPTLNVCYVSLQPKQLDLIWNRQMQWDYRQRNDHHSRNDRTEYRERRTITTNGDLVSRMQARARNVDLSSLPTVDRNETESVGRQIKDVIRIRFDEPQRLVAPGQYVALYNGEEVIGGGDVFCGETLSYEL